MASNQVQMDVTCENGVWTRRIDPADSASRGFGQKVLDGMKQVPERVGQIDGLTGTEDTYGAMVDRAVRCALWLRKQGIKPGDFVGLSTHNHLDTFVPVLGSIFSGAVFNAWWDWNLDEDIAQYFLKLSEPKVMFVNSSAADIIQKAINDLGMTTKVVGFDDSPDRLTLHDILKEQDADDVKNFQCTEIEDGNQPAVMIFTSGTTGQPKGVLHSYSWLSTCWLMDDKYVIDGTVLWSAGICWVSGVICTIHALKSCATAVVYHRLTAEIACHLIEKYKIKSIAAMARVATALYKDNEAKNHDLSSVKHVSFGGGSVASDVEQNVAQLFPNAEICFSYGMTELGIVIGRDDLSTKSATIGKIRRNWQLKVIHLTTGETVSSNVHGEMCFKSPYMMLRYHKNEESTKKAIDADGWFHSGDLGYYDADGDFYVVDRMNALIEYKQSMTVVPALIEEVILKHPSILDVGVVAKPDSVDFEVPMAFVTKREGANVTEEEIIKHVEDNLPDHMRLRGGVKILEKMPTTPTGKISKKCLREMAEGVAKAE